MINRNLYEENISKWEKPARNKLRPETFKITSTSTHITHAYIHMYTHIFTHPCMHTQKAPDYDDYSLK